MRTVRDDAGKSYLLVKRSSDGWLIRNPETGREKYRPASDLEVVEESALSLAADAIPEPIRTILTGVQTERSLGLLVELDRDGPLSVRALLERYEYCESDLHGRLAEFRAAGLIEERSIGGERGYATTDTARAGLDTLQTQGTGD